MKDSRLKLIVLTTAILVSGSEPVCGEEQVLSKEDVLFEEIELLSQKDVERTLSADQVSLQEASAPSSQASAFQASVETEELVLTFPEPLISKDSEPFIEASEDIFSFTQTDSLEVEIETSVPEYSLTSMPESSFDFPALDTLSVSNEDVVTPKNVSQELPMLEELSSRGLAVSDLAKPALKLEKKNFDELEDQFVDSLATRENIVDGNLEAATAPRQEIAANAAQNAHPAVVPASWNISEVSLNEPIQISRKIDWRSVFTGSPTIYSLLGLLSFAAVGIWAFNSAQLANMLRTSANLKSSIKSKLLSNHYEDVLQLCGQNESFLCSMLHSGVSARKNGPHILWETMRQEGKRISVPFWQRLSLLNDIALIAPMVGLLGTVLGMFYAFYDINRSTDSIKNLFDGLGISIGTTVSGLIVAVIAMMLHSIGKYRLTRSLAQVEQEALDMARLVDNRVSSSDKG